jgi:hypothetical protein
MPGRPVRHMGKTFDRSRVAAGISVSTHDTGAVLFHSGTGRVFVLNAAGARIWSAIEGRVTLHDIANDISRDYGIPFSTAWDDTTSFLTELEVATLIEVRPEP